MCSSGYTNALFCLHAPHICINNFEALQITDTTTGKLLYEKKDKIIRFSLNHTRDYLVYITSKTIQIINLHTLESQPTIEPDEKFRLIELQITKNYAMVFALIGDIYEDLYYAAVRLESPINQLVWRRMDRYDIDPEFPPGFIDGRGPPYTQIFKYNIPEVPEVEKDLLEQKLLYDRLVLEQPEGNDILSARLSPSGRIIIGEYEKRIIILSETQFTIIEFEELEFPTCAFSLDCRLLLISDEDITENENGSPIVYIYNIESRQLIGEISLQLAYRKGSLFIDEHFILHMYESFNNKDEFDKESLQLIDLRDHCPVLKLWDLIPCGLIPCGLIPCGLTKEKNTWSDFCSKGLYDPRLFLLIRDWCVIAPESITVTCSEPNLTPDESPN